MTASDKQTATKRYFYTEPLAAAWMAKQFGMRFVDKSCLPVSADPAMWYMAERHYLAGSLFIHPDSLHLLEPQRGDLIHANISSPHIMTMAPHCGYVTWGECVDPRTQYYDCKIIQRNGLSFFWPEWAGV